MLEVEQETKKLSAYELLRKSSDWGNVETKKLNRVGDIHAPFFHTLPWHEKRGRVKLYRQLAVCPFK